MNAYDPGLYLRARSLLSSIGINLGKRALVNEATWSRLLKRKDVPADMKKLLEILKTCIQEMSHAIAAVGKQYEPDLERSEVQRLQGIPAVGPIVAATTVAGLGDPARFKDSRTAAAYTGLVPSEHSSGERQRRGHITKRGPSELRRVWIQAAQAALRMKAHPLKAWAQRLIYRRGRAVAVVALARRTFRWAFAVWRDSKRFDVRLAVAP